VRLPGRTAPPHAYHHRGRHRRTGDRSGGPARRARPGAFGRSGAVRGGRPPPRRRVEGPHQVRRPRPDQPPAHAGGVDAAPLRRRTGSQQRGERRCAMTATATRPAPAVVGSPAADALAGTGTLVRFMLRRDRVRIPVWIGAISASTVLTALSFPDLYADAADRQARATLIENPGLRAFTGPGYGLEDYTFGAMMAHEMLSWIAVF